MRFYRIRYWLHKLYCHEVIHHRIAVTKQKKTTYRYYGCKEYSRLITNKPGFDYIDFVNMLKDVIE